MDLREDYCANKLSAISPAGSGVAKYLENISNFVTFLTYKDHTLQEILNHLNLVVFKSLHVSTVSFLQVNENNDLVVAARSGVSKELAIKLKSLYSLDDRYPNVDAIRTLSTIWINTLPDWGDEYPLMKNYPHSKHGKTFLAIPVFVTGTPVAVIAILSNTKMSPDIDTDAFLKAIGHILSMYMYRNVVSSPAEEENSSRSSNEKLNEVEGSNLTNRQLIILRLISENRTNLSISQFLGYSESTIRQEIMKIFAKLGCTHRKEAAIIYRGYISL